MDKKPGYIQRLSFCDGDTIAKTLLEIRNEGDFSLVPELLDLFLSSKNHTVTLLLTALLGDIKEPAFKPLLIERLLKTTDEEQRGLLLRICWESPLDFSEYLELFVDLLMEGQYITTLEAYTIISNLSVSIPEQTLQQLISRLSEHRKKTDNLFLIDESIQALEKLLPTNENRAEI